jgi:hypothetical protein
MRLGKVLTGQQDVKVALLGRKVRKTSARLRCSASLFRVADFLTAATGLPKILSGAASLAAPGDI